MNRSEYLINNLKKDFLQYSLLQEDSLSAKDIVEKIYGVIDLKWLIDQAKQEIESLYAKYLSFEKVKVDGKLSNELSQELGYDVKDRILAEYQNYLDSHSTDEITAAIIYKIERSIELQTWSNGLANMLEAVKLLVERLNNSSRSYGNLYTAPIPESEILEKFNKAKENTLLERIQGNNIDDIIEYRSALMQFVRVSCENMLYAKLKEVYGCSMAEYEGNDLLSILYSRISKEKITLHDHDIENFRRFFDESKIFDQLLEYEFEILDKSNVPDDRMLQRYERGVEPC